MAALLSLFAGALVGGANAQIPIDPAELAAPGVELAGRNVHFTMRPFVPGRRYQLEYSDNYADLPAGGGKAANHPVTTISWYEIVKWCNARSEKDGREPCYTVSGAIYRTGDGAGVVCDSSFPQGDEESSHPWHGI